MRIITALTGVVVLLAGCIGSEDAAPEAVDPEPTQSVMDKRPTLDLQPVIGDALNRNLSMPPKWKAGEWWTYELQDHFTGDTYVVTRVVAGVEGDEFLVGMPVDDFSNGIMVLHIPGFGQVNRLDLSFEIHDAPYEPLKFPLTQGKTWDTTWEGTPVTATVEKVEGQQADIVLTNGGGINIQARYDADIGEFVSWLHPNYGEYKILKHGFDYEGIVTVPHMHDLIFFQQRLGVPVGASGLEPQLTSDVVNVDPTYDRVSFVIAAGSLPGNLIGAPADAPQAYYKETATAPDGTVFELEVMPTDATGLHMTFHGQDFPGGDWRFDHLAAGPGIVMTEGIAYHVYDVELPSGRVLPSQGQHDHGG